MSDTDIFGVKNPESDETGYCCIMGNAGEHYAIAAYLGSEGLEGYFRILSGDVVPQDPEIMLMIRCLMCSFEDRNMLAPEDLKVIKELGLKFRGRNEWPLIRNYEPGLFPWFIDSAQARFLTHILRQALHVSLRCRENPEIIHHPDPHNFFVLVPKLTKTGEISWEEQYLTVNPPQKKYVSFTLNNHIIARKLKALKPESNLDLEIDTFFVPVPIREKGRPYYPTACLFVSHKSGMIVSHDMFKDIKNEGSTCIDMLIELIEKSGQKPSTILVVREETYHLLSEVCKQIDINLKMTDRLIFIEEAKYEMMDFF